MKFLGPHCAVIGRLDLDELPVMASSFIKHEISKIASDAGIFTMASDYGFRGPAQNQRVNTIFYKERPNQADWENDGWHRDRLYAGEDGLLFWSNVNPTEIRLADQTIVQAEPGEVVVILNSVVEREFSRTRRVKMKRQKFFTNVLVTDTKMGDLISLAGTGRDGNRYHIWINHDLSIPDYSKHEFTLYKNPPLSVPHRGEGYFPTRHLDAGAAANRKMVDELIAAAKEFNLVAVADERREQTERARKLEADRSYREYLKQQAGPALYEALKNLLAMVEGESPSLLEDDINAENAYVALREAEPKIGEQQ